MDLTAAVPVLLVITGAVLQYLIRARPGASEVAYLAWTAGLCTAVYVLVHWPIQGAWNVAIVDWLLWLGDPADGAIGRVLAGTGLTSILANLAVKAGASSDHAAVPVTKH